MESEPTRDQPVQATNTSVIILSKDGDRTFPALLYYHTGLQRCRFAYIVSRSGIVRECSASMIQDVTFARLGEFVTNMIFISTVLISQSLLCCFNCDKCTPLEIIGCFWSGKLLPLCPTPSSILSKSYQLCLVVHSPLGLKDTLIQHSSNLTLNRQPKTLQNLKRLTRRKN